MPNNSRPTLRLRINNKTTAQSAMPSNTASMLPKSIVIIALSNYRITSKIKYQSCATTYPVRKPRIDFISVIYKANQLKLFLNNFVLFSAYILVLLAGDRNLMKIPILRKLNMVLLLK